MEGFDTSTAAEYGFGLGDIKDDVRCLCSVAKIHYGLVFTEKEMKAPVNKILDI